MDNLYTLKGNVLKQNFDDVTARRRYKKATTHLDNLGRVAYAFDMILQGLAAFEIYVSVKRVLDVVRLERGILDFKMRELKKIVDSKGKE